MYLYGQASRDSNAFIMDSRYKFYTYSKLI